MDGCVAVQLWHERSRIAGLRDHLGSAHSAIEPVVRCVALEAIGVFGPNFVRYLFVALSHRQGLDCSRTAGLDLGGSEYCAHSCSSVCFLPLARKAAAEDEGLGMDTRVRGYDGE